jgi:hypothetical protein
LMGQPSVPTEVKRVDMLTVLRSFGIPFYVKIDVEGADYLVVEALKNFDVRPQYLSLEANKTNFNELRAEMDLLIDLGYTKFKVVQQETIGGSRLKSRTLDDWPLDYVFESCASGPFGADLPGSWLSYADTLKEYEAIFRRYKLFGEYAPVNRLPEKVQTFAKKLYKAGTGYRGPLPGWFDTHASL